MPKGLTEQQIARYRRDGFYFPVSILSAAEAHSCRDRLEAQERTRAGPLSGNMRHKVHDNFDPEPAPRADLHEAALAAYREAVDRSAKALYHGTGRTQFRA